MRYFLYFERLGRMHENKVFFLFFYFFRNIAEKTEYFNTGFVFLQYKNINKY